MIGAGVVLWRYEDGPLNVTVMDSVIPLQAKLTITTGTRGQLVARLGHSESQVDKAIDVLRQFPAMWRRGDN